MKAITVWLMRQKNKDGSYYWLHNHIEDGHSDRDVPQAKSKWQEQKWSKQAWIKVHGRLDKNRVILPGIPVI